MAHLVSVYKGAYGEEVVDQLHLIIDCERALREVAQEPVRPQCPVPHCPIAALSHYHSRTMTPPRTGDNAGEKGR